MPARAGYVRDEDLGFEALVIGDLDTDDSLEIQRAFAYDEQDRVVGIDSYCLVRAGGPVHYGGVDRWHLAPGRLQLSLTASCAQVLGLRQELSIELTEAAATLAREHLPRLLANPS
jgi:hypothetical protein